MIFYHFILFFQDLPNNYTKVIFRQQYNLFIIFDTVFHNDLNANRQCIAIIQTLTFDKTLETARLVYIC
jgi:hypothetical protein